MPHDTCHVTTFRSFGPAVVFALAGLPLPAFAQDAEPPIEVSSSDQIDLAEGVFDTEPPVETGSTDLAEVMEGPQDLPGHERGERTREPAEEKAPEPAPAADEREWFGGKPWWQWSRVTGDWAGGRTWLEDRGVTFAASYTFDWQSVWSGGLRNVASTRTVFDANVTFDFEKAFGLTGGSAFVDYYSTDMRGGSRDVGDFQGVDSIESGRNLDQVGEVWYQQKLFKDVLRLKAGKIGVWNEFAFANLSADNMHVAAGFISNILGFPTYPDPATAIVAFVYPTEQWYIGGGFFDGATLDGFRTGPRWGATFFSDDESESWFYIGETGLTWSELGGLGSGRALVGVWHHTADFTEFSGDTKSGTTGFYAIAEQQLWKRGESEEDSAKGLFAWAQFGLADEDVSAIGKQFGVGATLKGTCSARPDDTAGLFVVFADLSDDDNAGFSDDETAVELYYTVQATGAIKIKPDLQYIFNPGGSSDIDDALVGGVRVEITF